MGSTWALPPSRSPSGLSCRSEHGSLEQRREARTLVPCTSGSSSPSRGLSLPICQVSMLDQICRAHAPGHAATHP